jgi:hypothetical protein
MGKRQRNPLKTNNVDSSTAEKPAKRKTKKLFTEQTECEVNFKEKLLSEMKDLRYVFAFTLDIHQVLYQRT